MDSLNEEEMEFAKKGFVIDAIKAYRTRTNASLLDGKTIVENYLAKFAPTAVLKLSYQPIDISTRVERVTRVALLPQASARARVMAAIDELLHMQGLRSNEHPEMHISFEASKD